LGFPTGRLYIKNSYINTAPPTSFLAPLSGTDDEEEAATSTMHQQNIKPYLEYLTNKKLPKDEVQRRQIERRAKAYTITDGQLYKQSTSGVFMKCIPQVDAIKILREIHESECVHHAPTRSLVAKAFRHGFYCPTAKTDAYQIVELCQGCQIYSKQTHMPVTALHMIPITSSKVL
jgi:hypothetical protein